MTEYRITVRQRILVMLLDVFAQEEHVDEKHV